MAYDKVIDSAALDAQMTELADAIRAKAGTNSDLEWVSGFKSAVESIQTGGGGAPVHVEEKDVNFWDYDGTLLHSYTLAEAQALTELPPLPTRDGLICQGWNWTLEQIKSFGLQVEVGAVYITDDGKTRIKIDVSSMLIANVTLNFGDAIVNIDWGDGSAIETSPSAAAAQQYTHQYAATGIYTIALEVVRGTLRLGGNSSDKPLIGGSANDATRCATEVYYGSNLSDKFGYLSMQHSRKLRLVTIPEGVSIIASGVFYATSSLVALILPSTVREMETIATVGAMKVLSLPWGITTLGSTTNASGLTRFVLPPNLVTLKNQVGYGAVVSVLHLPASLTTIGSNCFHNQQQLVEIYCHSPTPPTIGTPSMLSAGPTYQKIYVPAGSLEAYQTATNWTAYADRMEEWNP